MRLDDGQSGAELGQKLLDGPDVMDFQLGGPGELGPGHLAEGQAKKQVEMEFGLPGVQDLVVHGPGLHGLGRALAVLEREVEAAQVEGVDQFQRDVVALEGGDGQGGGVRGPEEEHHAAQDLVPRGAQVDIHRLAPREETQRLVVVGGIAFDPCVGEVVGQVEKLLQYLGLEVVGLGGVPPDLPQGLLLVGVGDTQVLGPSGGRRPGKEIGSSREQADDFFVDLRQFLRQGEIGVFVGHASRVGFVVVCSCARLRTVRYGLNRCR